MSEDAEITAKQLAEITGEKYHTINLWTTMKLLPIKRTHGRIRYYDRTDSVRRCEKIRELQNERYTLDLIGRQLLG
jgi:DNA-binding transcriptional MerR regulator